MQFILCTKLFASYSRLLYRFLSVFLCPAGKNTLPWQKKPTLRETIIFTITVLHSVTRQRCRLILNLFLLYRFVFSERELFTITMHCNDV